MEENGLQLAKSTLENGAFTCVIVKEMDMLSSKENGIRPIIHWLRSTPETLRKSAAADKVIGKAAAMLFVYGEVKVIYAAVISKPALAFLRENNVEVSYGNLVEYIKNRDGTGMCPMETKALNLNTAEEAFNLFNELVK